MRLITLKLYIQLPSMLLVLAITGEIDIFILLFMYTRHRIDDTKLEAE